MNDFQLVTTSKDLRPGIHYAGWPTVQEALALESSDEGRVLLSGGVESVISSPATPPLNRPWAGVIHHPWGFPEFYNGCRPENWSQGEKWQAYRETCAGMIAMSRQLADDVQEKLGIPCRFAYHPMPPVESKFSISAFAMNPKKLVLHIGTFGRNVWLLQHLPAIKNYQKRLLPVAAWLRGATQKHYRGQRVIRDQHGVVSMSWVPNAKYDELLSQNIVVVEFLGAAANNLVLECLRRGTPLLTNRIAGVEDYLGSDYPLYYDDYTEIPSILHDFKRLSAGHEYLVAREAELGERIDVGHFVRECADFCREVVA